MAITSMSLDEIKIKIGEIAEEIANLENSEQIAYADLGRRILPELEGNAEYAAFTDRIKGLSTRLINLKFDESELEKEQKRRFDALTCFKCKTVNLEGAVFCEECGVKLGEKPREYCEACGTMNRPDQKFCGECGAKLTPAG